MSSPSSHNRIGVYRPTFLPDSSKFSETVLPILSSILTDLCKTNDRCQPIDKSHMKITKFHAAQVPPISIEAYLKRIAQYSEASDTCYILALVYLDRIQARPEFLVTSLNIHRLLITSVMVAAKFFDDHYYNNAFYARIGGISKEEMNSLELEFLFMIGFSLSVSHAEFAQYDSELRAHYARREAAAAGASATATVAISQPQAMIQPHQQHQLQQQQQQQQYQQPQIHIQPNHFSSPIPVVSAPAYSAPACSHAAAAGNHRRAPSASNARATFSYPHPSFYDAKEQPVYGAAPYAAHHNGAGSMVRMQVEDSPKFSAHAPAGHSNGIAIRGSSKSRTSAPACSPPVSDFSSEYASQQWLMIK